MRTTRRSIRAAAVLAALAATAFLAACDVTNPGPVQDEFLDLAEAHQALVNGAAARMAQSIGYNALTGGFAARELFPTGQCCGHPNQNPSMQARVRASDRVRVIKMDAVKPVLPAESTVEEGKP